MLHKGEFMICHLHPRCPSSQAPPQHLAALHCLLVYMGNDPNLELKVQTKPGEEYWRLMQINWNSNVLHTYSEPTEHFCITQYQSWFCLFTPGVQMCPECVSCDLLWADLTSVLYIQRHIYVICVRKDQIMLHLPSLNLQMCPMSMCVSVCVCVCLCVSAQVKKTERAGALEQSRSSRQLGWEGAPETATRIV